MLPDWSSLPEHLLVQALGLLDQDERLRNSALVNAAWAAAARRATHHATCSVAQQQQQNSLRDFLRHGDSGVQSVKLFGVEPTASHYPLLPVTVPLSGVTRLEVEGAKFPVAPIGHKVADSIPLTGLRQLDLRHCESHISSLAAALQGSCSSLTSLLLGEPWGHKRPHQLNDLLQQLTVLAELELPCWHGDELLALPVGLTRLLLRRPYIHTQPNTHSTDVSTLLQPLTSLQVLQLRGVSLQHPLSLTGLREVDLNSVHLDLSVLSSAYALQRLKLTDCTSISAPDFSVSALHCLSDLRVLNLGGDGAAGAIMQLTSLSLGALTQLNLEDTISKEQWDVLAQDVVSRATGLRKLVLGDPLSLDWPGATHITLDQLHQLVSSCSQLQHLSLATDITSPAVTSGLMHLPRTCTHLELAGNDWCFTVLAQLTWLTELSWEGFFKLGDVSLRQLTALRNLQALSLGWCWGMSAELGRAIGGLGPGSSCQWSEGGGGDDDGSCELYLSFKSGPQGSVCEQLQAVCNASPQCALADLPGLRDELAALREQNKQLLFEPLQHVVVDEAAAAAGGVDQMRQQLVVMSQAVEGLLSRGMYAALLDGLSGSQPTAEQFAEACTAVREQNTHRLLRVLKAVVDGG